MKTTGIDTSALSLPQAITYITKLENEIEILKEQVNLLLLKRFGRSSEHYDPNQALLFTAEEEGESAHAKAGNEKQIVKSYVRNGGRKAIDPKIERREKIIDISEAEKQCACGCKMDKIGEETNEKLIYVPESVYVEKIIRPKYACRHCEGTEDEGKPTVRIAPVPPAIIPRSIASPSLLSRIMIQKYQDHLPFHRQELQFQRIGVEISRQDMSNWQQRIYQFLLPVFALLRGVLKSGPVIRMDETTAQVMGEEGRADDKTSYIWLARGGPPDKTVVIYEYHPTREAKHIKEILAGYSGYLQTDGYEGYDSALKTLPGIIHAGCFAHSRRKFFEAAKAAKKPQSAEVGLSYIKTLCAILPFDICDRTHI